MEQSLQNADIVEKLVVRGDLSGLSQEQKVRYYIAFCKRLGLDPMTQPFKILRLNGKEVLYCDRSGVQQLNKLYSISHEITSRELIGDIYVVTARATINDNGSTRSTESIGAVPLDPELPAVERANLIMKAETKSKRRATLDLVGLGWLCDEEVETIENAEVIEITPQLPHKEEPNNEPTQAQKRKLYAELRDRGLTREEMKRFWSYYNPDKSSISVILDNVDKAVAEWRKNDDCPF
ncbi:MAG: hypothetical protein QXW98_07120 [Candidatus Caldarchaeum sp.]